MAHTYTNIPYDLRVDTFAETTEQCADRIISFLDNPSAWTALKAIKNQIEESRTK